MNNCIKYKYQETQSTKYLLSNLACGCTYISQLTFVWVYPSRYKLVVWPYIFVLLLTVIKASYDKLYTGIIGKNNVCWRLVRSNHRGEDLFKCKISNVEMFFSSWVCYINSKNNVPSRIYWILLRSIILCCLSFLQNNTVKVSSEMYH